MWANSRQISISRVCFTSDPRPSVSLLNLLPKLIQFYEEGMGLIWILGSIQQILLSLTLRLDHWHGHIYTYLGCFVLLLFLFFYQLEVSRCLFYFSLSPSTPSQSISRFSVLLSESNICPLTVLSPSPPP